jgi:hypothetical protein
MHEDEECAEEKALFSRRSNQVRPKDARSNKKITNNYFFCNPTEKLVILKNVVWS